MKKKQQAKKSANSAAPAKALTVKPYKIETGIKVSEPTQRSGGGYAGRFVVTANLMKVGDSFLIKDATDAVRAEKSARDLNRRGRLSGTKRTFVTRRVKGGLRIWRTA